MPDGWETVECGCGIVIAGYPRDTAPSMLFVEHFCGHTTTVYPFNMASGPHGASLLITDHVYQTDYAGVDPAKQRCTQCARPRSWHTRFVATESDDSSGVMESRANIAQAGFDGDGGG